MSSPDDTDIAILALREVGADWSDTRAAYNRRGVSRRIVRKRQQRRAAGAAMVVAGLSLVLLLFTWAPTNAPDVTGPISVAGPIKGALVLSDLSQVTPSGIVEATVLEDSAQRQAIEVRSGEVRFAVTPRGERAFSVLLPHQVRVDVLGTKFTTHAQADRVFVSVEHGRVRVSWSLGEVILRDGESGVFPPTPSEVTADRAAQSSLVTEGPAEEQPGTPLEPVRSKYPSWQKLAKDGLFEQAHAALKAAPAPATSAELLLAADAARLSGHPSEAADYLQQVTREFPNDPQRPLAAFMLGRLYLSSLGRPAQAAAQFAAARAGNPGGGLAEDALAREVEAWSRAGSQQKATERAKEYVKRYPEGRRKQAVRQHGKL